MQPMAGGGGGQRRGRWILQQEGLGDLILALALGKQAGPLFL